MSSSQVESVLDSSGGGTGHGGPGRRALAHNINSNFNKKHIKHDGPTANHNHKFSRKRMQNQVSGSGGGKFHPPHKKRRSQTSILPTKFLLGGNICDPLNLGSLQDEDINRAMNAVTPKSSPLPTPKHRKGEIEVIIPPNINDPLNLNSCENDEEYVAQLAKTSPIKRPRGKSKRKKKRINSSSISKEEPVDGSACTEATTVSEPPSTTVAVSDAEVQAPAAPLPSETSTTASRLSLDLHLNLEIPTQDAATPNLESPTKKAAWQRRSEDPKDRRLKKMDLKDKIVSPVIWQPGTKPPHPRNRHKSGKNESKEQYQPKFNPKNAAFQYGNYNRYYGYRNVLNAPDVRLKCFSNFPDLFKDKDVLDIGCNIGHITLSVGRDFRSRSVIGIDIDRGLIEIARKNVQHYVNYEQTPSARGTPNNANYEEAQPEQKPHERFFPISMPIVYGPVDIPGITDGMAAKGPSAPKPFPQNVSFVQGNYVLQSDALLALEKPQFDVILCLSMTKWIHLNWGDDGLKRAFKRMFAQLRPGGRLILEAQGWTSYRKKKAMTENIWKTFKSIKFFPHQFRAYLLSPEVGFTKSQVLDVPQHSSKGFCRPIVMFFKSSDEEKTTDRAETVTNVTTSNSERCSDATESPNTSKCFQTPKTDGVETSGSKSDLGDIVTNVTALNPERCSDTTESPDRLKCIQTHDKVETCGSKSDLGDTVTNVTALNSDRCSDTTENPDRPKCIETLKSPDVETCGSKSDMVAEVKDSSESREASECSRITDITQDVEMSDSLGQEVNKEFSSNHDKSVELDKVQCTTEDEVQRTEGMEPLPPRLDKTDAEAVFS